MSRDFQLPGRSPVYATNGMAATSHPLATEAAVNAMRRGGNAIDAAITAAAVLAVVEPAMTGIGGDCFAIYAEAGKPLVGINGAGRAPAATDLQWFLDQGLDEVPVNSPQAVTIPGAVDAWDRLLKDHGTISLGDALQPAIRFAEEGFAVAPRVAYDWAKNAGDLLGDAGSSAIYLKDGAAPVEGDIYRLPRLAKTLRVIADKGRGGFYEGETAEALVKHLRAIGGVHSLDDFAGVAADYVAPVLSNYRGIDLAEIPPPTHGVTAQILLKILEQFDLKNLDPDGGQRFHLEIEASRSAYRFRDKFIADPDYMTVSVEGLLSEQLAKDLAGKIDPDRRTADLGPVDVPGGSDTVYLTVVDSNWNAVSFINSIYKPFGSAITDPTTGVLFHSRGNCFRVDPGHPNCIGPDKRPMHTIIPAMVMRDGRAILSYGVMGAAYQPVGQIHALTNVFDFGMDIQQAFDHPRLFGPSGPVEYERGISVATRKDLVGRGHELNQVAAPHGGGQGIFLDWQRGVLVGGSDPRKDGAALGF